jgi:hypothetical protein
MLKVISRRTALFAAGLPVALAAALLSSGTASAAQQQICGNSGSGYCLNAWNGGPAVKMYYGSSSHEDFYTELVPLCNGSYVTSTCPLANHIYDNELKGAEIEQIVYAPTGQCVGSDSSGHGTLTGCNSVVTGTGGGNGTIQIVYGEPGCYGFPPADLLNRHYTDLNDAWRNVESGGNPGQPLIMNASIIEGQPTCWGGIS